MKDVTVKQRINKQSSMKVQAFSFSPNNTIKSTNKILIHDCFVGKFDKFTQIYISLT